MSSSSPHLCLTGATDEGLAKAVAGREDDLVSVRVEDSPSLTSVAPLSALPNLRWLELHGVGSSAGPLDLTLLSALGRLVHLRLSGVPCSNATIMPALQKMPSLQRVFVDDAHLHRTRDFYWFMSLCGCLPDLVEVQVGTELHGIEDILRMREGIEELNVALPVPEPRP